MADNVMIFERENDFRLAIDAFLNQQYKGLSPEEIILVSQWFEEELGASIRAYIDPKELI